MRYLLMFGATILLFSCAHDREKEGQVLIICVRDKDTLHTKILNKTEDTIYVPSKYLGIYNVKEDTIFLEEVDKPEYGSDLIYRYSKVFPFEFYLPKELGFEKPDTAIRTRRQVYYFNQFLVEPFVAIYPDSSFFNSLTFYVPGRARTVQAVYYSVPFLKNNKKNQAADYTIGDWVKFDSLNSKYAIAEVLDRVYLD